MRKRLNIGLLLSLFVLTSVFVLGCYLRHGAMVKYHKNGFKEKAKQAMALSPPNFQEAASLYMRYLSYDEREVDAWSQLTDVLSGWFEKHPADAFLFSFTSLKNGKVLMPESPQKRKLVRVLCEKFEMHPAIRKYSDALENLNYLLNGATPEEQRELKLLRCQALHGDSQNEEALEETAKLLNYDRNNKSFTQAPSADPKLLQAYLLLADLMSRHAAEPEAASQIMDRLVEANPTSGEAFLQRGFLRLSEEKNAEAEADFREALKLDPENLLAALSLIDVLSKQERFAEASETLEAIKEKHPKVATVFRTQATIELNHAAKLKGEEAQARLESALAAIDEGLEYQPENVDLLSLKIEILLSKRDEASVKAAEETHGKLSRVRGVDIAVVKYLNGRLKATQKDYETAAVLLESIRPQLNSAAQTQADYELAQCYRALKKPDIAEQAIKRVLAQRPNDANALMILASLEVRRRSNEAIPRLEDVISILENVEGTEQAVKALESGVINEKLSAALDKQLFLPEAERKWDEVDRLAQQLFNLIPKEDQVGKLILNAEVNSLKRRLDKAEEYFTRARAAGPDRPLPWVASARFYWNQQRNYERALALLDEGAKRIPNHFQILGTKAGLIISGPQPEAEKVKLLSEMAEAYEKIENAEQRYSLFFSTGVQTGDEIKDYATAEKFLLKARELQPKNFDCASALMQMYQMQGEPPGSGDLAKIDQLVADGATRFGKDSLEHKYLQAVSKVSRYRHALVSRTAADDKLLTDAQELLTEISLKRPNWALLPQLSGAIDQFQGRLESAADRMAEVLRQNPNDATAASRLFMLRVQQRNNEEAMAIAKTMLAQDQPARILRLVADFFEEQTDFENSIRAHTRLVSVPSATATDLLAYGLMLDRFAANLKTAGKTDESQKRTQEAEAKYRKAIEMQPDAAQGYLGLISHLAKTERAQEARKVELQAAEKLPKEDVDMFRGQIAELTQRPLDAEKFYLQAIAARGDDPPVLQAVASFFLRTQGKQKDGFALLDRLIQMGEAKGNNAYFWARIAKAEQLANTRDYQDFLAAMKLLEDEPAFPPAEAPRIKLLKAFILTGRAEPSAWKKGIELFSDMGNDRAMSAQESLSLAKLYRRTGDLPAARQTLTNGLLNLRPETPGYKEVLTELVEVLIDSGEYEEAEERSERLPPLPKFFAQAKLLVKQGKSDQLMAMVEQMKSAVVNPEDFGEVADLFETLVLYDEATAMFTEFERRDPKAALIRVAYLARRGMVDEALERVDTLLRQTGRMVPELLEAGHDAVLRNRQTVTPEQLARVEKWLQLVLESQPDNTAIQIKLAELRDLQGQQQEVAQIYEKLLQRTDLQPLQRAIVLNNLTYNLAMMNETSDRTLPMIEEAISILGPRAYLLDTRGLAHLNRKEFPQAVADLREAVYGSEDPLLVFHLAWVEHVSGETKSAADHFHRALVLKLNANSLTGTEKGWFDTLMTKYGPAESTEPLLGKN